MNEIYVEWQEFNGNWVKSTPQDSFEDAVELFNAFYFPKVRILCDDKIIREK